MNQKTLANIQSHLSNIEKEEKIEVLFAVENGSRAWGFDSKDSDFDIRFVYVQTIEDYLKINKKKKETIDKVVDSSGDSLDFSGWDIRKFLFLLSKSNPVSIEWVSSPIIYKGSRDLFYPIDDFVNQKNLFHHYSSLAKSNYERFIRKERKEVKLKKYFYVLRGIINAFYVKELNEFPPMNFEDTIEIVNKKYPTFLQNDLFEKIKSLLKKKKEGENVKTQPLDDLEKFIEKWFAQEKLFSKIESYQSDQITDKVNDIFFKILKIKKK